MHFKIRLLEGSKFFNISYAKMISSKSTIKLFDPKTSKLI